MSTAYYSPPVVYWERRGSQVYAEVAEGETAICIADLHGHPNAVAVAQQIVDAHNAVLEEFDDEE